MKIKIGNRMQKYLFEWQDRQGTHFIIFERNFLTTARTDFQMMFGKVKFRMFEVGDLVQDWINE